MRVISWNMNKRTEGCWDYLLDSYDPDYIHENNSPKGLGLLLVN